jgi:hypothetical protein
VAHQMARAGYVFSSEELEQLGYPSRFDLKGILLPSQKDALNQEDGANVVNLTEFWNL